MDVTINGERQALPESTTAAQLLERLKISPERVVVELNLMILKRAQLPSTVLKEGDHVEIVHMVGGGSVGRKTQDSRGKLVPRVSSLES